MKQKAAVITIPLAFSVVGAPPTKLNLRGGRNLRQRFDKDGYIVLRDFFEKEFLNDWAAFEEKVFRDIFEELYDDGHTTFAGNSRSLII